MTEYLFLFTITPVQTFISQARKTQDLYAGSSILSHLCRQAMVKVRDEWQGEIVFPSLELESLPNRFLAIVKGENEEVFREKGYNLEKELLSELRKMSDIIFDSFRLEEPPGFWNQVKNYFQFYWVFYPLDTNYAHAYKMIEQLLGQIKVRSFAQIEETGGRKCSLTGEHNALFYRPLYDNSYKNKRRPAYLVGEAVELSETFPLKYMASGEALGSIAFLKRLAPYYFRARFVKGGYPKTSFPSTCRIALFDAFNKLLKKDSTMASLIEREFDEELIYELQKRGCKEKSEPDYNREFQAYESSKQEKEIAMKICSKLQEYKIEFSPYYAVVIFDGDNMGEWLSGKKLRDKTTLKDFHSCLSRELSKFARKAVEEILVKPRGATVYAGGDDFLGFVNLNYLFMVLKELRTEFDNIDLSHFTSEKLTFSAGIAIGHYKTPLSVVLQWARQMEKEAKSLDSSKDALSMAVIKRSGEIIKFRTKWKNSQGWFTDQLQTLLAGLREEFSTSFITNFCAEFALLKGNWQGIQFLDGMVDSELERLLARSYKFKDKDGVKKQKTKYLMQALRTQYIENNLDEFLSFLEILRFLAREVEIRAVTTSGF